MARVTTKDAEYYCYCVAQFIQELLLLRDRPTLLVLTTRVCTKISVIYINDIS